MNNELWLIWKDFKTRSRHKIGILKFINNVYIFEYFKDVMELEKLGFDYYPGFDDLNKVYSSKELFANIDTRLPNKNRPDYLAILNAYNLDISSTKFEILRATKGRLITDNYEFVPVFDNKKIEFDVAGTRYCNDLKKCKKSLEINEKLFLERELNNKFDKYAIKVLFEKDKKKYHIGYVPKYYSKELSELIDKKVEYSAMIKSLNLESKIFDEEITALVKIIFKK